MSKKRWYHNRKDDDMGYCCEYDNGKWSTWYKHAKKWINTKVRRRLKKDQEEQLDDYYKGPL